MSADDNKSSVRNKQLPTCPSQVEFAGGKLKVSEGCPLDKLQTQIRPPRGAV